MSAERRYEQRRFQLEQSTTLNGGARTIFIESMSPGTSVPPHSHQRFSETFELISGAMSVFTSAEPDVAALEKSPQKLEIAKPVTMTPGLHHQYVVDGDEQVTLRVTLTPGDADFERLLMIMNGMHADGELEKMGDSVELMAVVMGLSDAHLIGPARGMLDGVRATKGAEIEALKARLLAKYDTPEALKALLV